MTDQKGWTRREFVGGMALGAGGLTGAAAFGGQARTGSANGGFAADSAGRPLLASSATVEQTLAKLQPNAAAVERLRLTGYADRMSVRPGETIRFMVRSEFPRYRADIVRLISSEARPQGPPLKEEPIRTPVSAEYDGNAQPFFSGSWIQVPDSELLRVTAGVTLAAWVAPSSPGKVTQGLLGKWSQEDAAGYALVVNPDGLLEFRFSELQGAVHSVSADRPLAICPAAALRLNLGYLVSQHVNTHLWHFVAVSFDSASGKVVFFHQEQEHGSKRPATVITRSVRASSIGTNRVAFHIGAGGVSRAGAGWRAEECFNGKIDSPSIHARALSVAELEALGEGRPADGCVAHWNFAREPDGPVVRDDCRNELHGVSVNRPLRGVTGRKWVPGTSDFEQAPEQYGAIRFHEDDLCDLQWVESFRLEVPSDLRSGFYAARLTTDHKVDRVPFFVRPPEGSTTAPIAFLAPTYSYMAYSGENLYLQHLRGQYDRHVDGSGVAIASRWKPLLEMRPDWPQRRHYTADLYLINFLERRGIVYDVVTDEDLDREGLEAIRGYRCLITGSHPEYCTGAMLDGLEAFTAAGGRLMYMGANGFYWVVSTSASQPGVTEIRRWGGTQLWSSAPGEHHFPSGEPGGLWRARGRAPQRLTGIGFAAQGWDNARPYRRHPASFDARVRFIFEGIETDTIGDLPSVVFKSGAAGDEIDRFDHALGTPRHAVLLATARGFSDEYQHVVEEVNMSDSKTGGSVNEFVRADMTYFETSNGGAVFSVGSIAWFGAMAANDYDNDVARVTENVIRRFASAEPLPSPPAA